jgi:hypothetical protein
VLVVRAASGRAQLDLEVALDDAPGELVLVFYGGNIVEEPVLVAMPFNDSGEATLVVSLTDSSDNSGMVFS